MTVSQSANAAPAAAAQPAATGTSFYTSFEPGHPQPGYTDTVETGPDGKPRADGVRGPTPTGIGGSEMDKVDKITASGENSPGEVASNAADGDKFTKWLVFTPTASLTYHTAQPITLRKYALTSANDAAGRDPRNWTVSGSTDGSTWTVLDTKTDQVFASRFQTREFAIPNATAYSYFKLDVTRNGGENIVQLADWFLSNGAPLPPAPEAAESRLDSGPTSAYNARARAGFTGMKSFRFAGHQTTEGHGYTWNRVADVDLKVNQDTRLSYKLFPEHVEGDLSYPSTYTALDLAFSDGTYLSDLKAKDQHGFELSPRGQGDAKGLSTNQWNNVEADLGKVAAGKTVKRILIGYDKPAGPADFRSWLDDVRITRAANPDDAARKLAATHPADLAVTTRGTNSTGGFSRGNNIPATAVPHGFNFWTPVTNAGSTSWLYDYAKGNNDQNRPELQALSISHEPSPWMGDRQTFQVMPQVVSSAKAPTANRDARAWSFSHDLETATPYYYGLTADNGNTVEIAPTDHAAMLRFSFPQGQPALVFDNVSNLGGLTLNPKTGVVTGYSDVKSGLSTGAGRLFVYGVVDQKVVASGKLADGGGPDVGGYFTFGKKTRQVQLRIATSLIGTAQAKRNLELELGAKSRFDQVKAAARAQWDAKLSKVQVEGASADQLTTMYSNLYRLFLYPNSGSENTGTAKKPVVRYASPVAAKVGTDTPTTTGSKIVAGQTYVNNGFWDTYRTVWPAYSLFSADTAGELVDGFVQQYRDSGWIARWSSPGYANLMVGTSSDVAFADAHLKGIKGVDTQSMYDAAIKNGAVRPPNVNVGRKGMDRSVFNGYTANTTAEGFSWSMDGYINDFGIANLSKSLYDQAKKNDPRKQEYLDNYHYYLNRARNYVTLFDPAIDFFQGKDPSGVWGNAPSTFDPRDWGRDYTETNGWNMAFSVPQDGAGLAALYGGREGLANKLNEFFTTPEDATHVGGYGGTIHEMLEARDVRMGQYGHSNQPSHHIPYMYNFAGKPDKTQEKVREILDRLYLGSEIGQGYPGDEDNGEMSAWYLFSMLGFYPLQVGAPTYAIGAPLFTKATVELGGGRKLVVSAPKNSAKNLYVKGVKVNGKAWTSTALPHDLIGKGGTIEFDMTDQPSAWGTGRADAPPSLTKPGEDPKTWRDSTEDTGAVTELTSAGATDVSALTDNNSTTQVTLPGAKPTVTVTLPQGRPVTMYTLTSGTTGAAPSGWTLEGSNDGTRWTTVDRRSGQGWTHPSYTRAFSVTAPKAFTRYRLVLTAAPGATGVTLSDLELLGTLKGIEAGKHPSEQRVRQTKPSPTPSQSIERNFG